MRRTSRRPHSHAALMYSSTTDLMSRGLKAWRSRASSIGIRMGPSTVLLGFGIWDLGFGICLVRCRDDRLDAAAYGKVAHDSHASRLTDGDKIVQDLVGHRFVEDAAISEFDHVVLQ